MLCEFAALLRSRGRTLLDALDVLHLRHGAHHEDLLNLSFEGAEGAACIRRIVASWRKSPPAVIDGEPLRLSHIFDDIDAVDEMEFDEDNLPDEPFDLVRQVDKYFARDELGRRNILVPEIGDLLKQEGRG